MNTIPVPQWIPFKTLFRREVARFCKVLTQTVLTPMINSSLYLLIFGVSLGESIQLSSGLSYLAFLIPGIVMMGCLNNAYQNSSSSIISSKFSGDLEDLKVSPLTPHHIIWAMSLGGLLRGMIVAVITFMIGQIFFYTSTGHLLAVAHPLALLAFLVVGGVSFAQLGISVAFWAKTFDQLSAVSAFILMPLLYLGGVFFSIEGLHPFWRGLSHFNPLLYMINGVRYGLVGESDVEPLLAMAVSLLSLMVFHAVALRSLKSGSFMRW